MEHNAPQTVHHTHAAIRPVLNEATKSGLIHSSRINALLTQPLQESYSNIKSPNFSLPLAILFMETCFQPGARQFYTGSRPNKLPELPGT